MSRADAKIVNDWMLTPNADDAWRNMPPEVFYAAARLARDTLAVTDRKIVQIAAAGHENVSTTQSNLTLFALCNDGTVWDINNQQATWRQLPPIPQAEPDS